MTVSIRRMSLGSGYRYLLDSVAHGDATGVAAADGLTRYYAESGTPPGRFLGAGLAGLNRGAGVAEGSEVSEEMLFAMLGMLADPITGEPLGRAPRRWPKPQAERVRDRIAEVSSDLTAEQKQKAVEQITAEEAERERRLVRPVAGFDLTFSVPKSVSAAWALADGPTQAVIYQAHQDAIRHAIDYAEQTMLCSRSGTNGVVQEDIRGVVAVGFDHWDSRAGDPHLHTHVIVLNRAQTPDGTWRAVDSRALFRQVVALSELHEGLLSDLLTERLGWGWDERARRHSPVPRHDVAGVSDALIAEFSQRAEQIEQRKSDLVAEFAAAHGRQPSSTEALRMRQRATLETRPAKEHQSLQARTEQWRTRARPYVGDDTVAWVQTLRDRNDLPPLRRADMQEEILRDAAAVATAKVAERRPTFTRANMLAEVHRLLHGVRFASPEDRLAVADRTTELALADAVLVSAPERYHVPAQFRRPDGSSRFRARSAEIYTTAQLLEAEDRLLQASRTATGPTVSATTVTDAAASSLPGKDHGMSADQVAAIEAVATSGRVLDVLVGPAGTGKTTALSGLRTAWELEHGPGSVIGLAPSAAAAEVLAEEIGIDAENTAKWLSETRRLPDRLAEIDRLRARLAGLSCTGSVLSRSLDARIAQLQDECARWMIGPGQLVIVDEASLAGTFTLDEIVSQADATCGKVVLVGDPAQLTAIEAGGAFAMLVRDRDIAPELSEVRRFTHQWEKAASLKLRSGDATVIADYTRHDRIRSGDRADMLNAMYTAWREDIRAGLVSLMIAPDVASVIELNHRARADRIAAGEVDARGAEIAADGTAGVGDCIVTRANNRRLAIGANWVKNGDVWTVQSVAKDGSLCARRAGGGGQVLLPAEYVREHVELAYAATTYRAQGRTVDTAHALVCETTTREVLYVAATRGRDSNRIYVDTCYDPDLDTNHGVGSDRAPEQVLTAILDNVGSDVAAHTMTERELVRSDSISQLTAERDAIAGRAVRDGAGAMDPDLQRGLAEREAALRRRRMVDYDEPPRVVPEPIELVSPPHLSMTS